MSEPSTPRFQFSIAELLVITTVVGVILSVTAAPLVSGSEAIVIPLAVLAIFLGGGGVGRYVARNPVGWILGTLGAFFFSSLIIPLAGFVGLCLIATASWPAGAILAGILLTITLIAAIVLGGYLGGRIERDGEKYRSKVRKQQAGNRDQSPCNGDASSGPLDWQI